MTTLFITAPFAYSIVDGIISITFSPEIGIITITAGQFIISRTAVQDIIPRAAKEFIISTIAIETILQYVAAAEFLPFLRSLRLFRHLIDLLARQHRSVRKADFLERIDRVGIPLFHGQCFACAPNLSAQVIAMNAPLDLRWLHILYRKHIVAIGCIAIPPGTLRITDHIISISYAPKIGIIPFATHEIVIPYPAIQEIVTISSF